MNSMNEMNLNELRDVSGGIVIAPKNPYPVFDFDPIKPDPDPDFPDGPFGRDPVRASLPEMPFIPVPGPVPPVPDPMPSDIVKLPEIRKGIAG